MPLYRYFLFQVLPILYTFYFITTCIYAKEDVLFTSKSLWELTSTTTPTPYTPKLYTSKGLPEVESTTLSNPFLFRRSFFPTSKLYTSKVKSTTEYPLTFTRTSTVSILNTITYPTKRRTTPTKKKHTTRLTTPLPMAVSKPTPTYFQNQFTTKKNVYRYRSNPQVTETGGKTIYYQNPNQIPTSTNEVYQNNLQGSITYRSPDSTVYKFDMQPNNKMQLITNGQRTDFSDVIKAPAEMIRDGNNYKLVIYV